MSSISAQFLALVQSRVASGMGSCSSQWLMRAHQGWQGMEDTPKGIPNKSMYYMLLANSSDWVAMLQMMLFLIAKSLIHFFFCLATDLFCYESSHWRTCSKVVLVTKKNILRGIKYSWSFEQHRFELHGSTYTWIFFNK